MNPETFYSSKYASPLGDYILLSSRGGLVCLCPATESAEWLERYRKMSVNVLADDRRNAAVMFQLDRYFTRQLRQFSVPLDLRGTAFQRSVWDAMLKIPYGETRSYWDIARAIGRPNSARPVGGAVGANPVSIVVPCHRVVGADGSLTGYGGGLWRKKALLALESA